MAEQERFTQRGWEVIRLTSATLAVDLIPELGGTICSVRRRSDDLELLYRTPWGLPRFGGPQLGGTAEVIRHDANPGGWQSLFPNGGDTVVIHGSDQGYDGEARIASFGVVEEHTDADGARLVLTVPRLRRSPMTMTKIITLSADTLSVTETVRNVGSAEREVMWGSQLHFGAPLVDKDTEIDCGASLVHPDATLLYDVDYEDVTPWPRTPGPKSAMINLRYLPEPGPDSNRLAYLTEFDQGTASVTNRTLDCRVSIDWDAEQWPHCWYRLEAGGDTDFPWFGKGWFLSLTPNTSWPAHGLHDARRIGDSTVKIQPEEERTATVTLRVGAAH